MEIIRKLYYIKTSIFSTVNGKFLSGEVKISNNNNIQPEAENEFLVNFEKPMNGTPKVFMTANRDNFILQVTETSKNGFNGWYRNMRNVEVDGNFTIFYLATTI